MKTLRCPISDLPGQGPELRDGMVLAIEPMVNAGRYEVQMGDDSWAIYTKDGSLSAHFEHTVAITKRGPRVLTVAQPEEETGREAH